MKKIVVITDEGNYEIDAAIGRWKCNYSLWKFKEKFQIPDDEFQMMYDEIVEDYLNIWWCTHHENKEHATRMGRKKRGINPQYKAMTDDQYYWEETAIGSRFETDESYYETRDRMLPRSIDRDLELIRRSKWPL